MLYIFQHNQQLKTKYSPFFFFFQGYILRFIRLAPHTILTFVFYEQLRLNFGIKTYSWMTMSRARACVHYSKLKKCDIVKCQYLRNSHCSNRTHKLSFSSLVPRVCQSAIEVLCTFMGWRFNETLASSAVRMTIFNNLFSFTQKSLQIGFTWTSP